MNEFQQLLHAMALLQDLEGTLACAPRVTVEEGNSYTVTAYLHTSGHHYHEHFAISSDLMTEEEREERLGFLIDKHREYKARNERQEREFKVKEAAKKKLSPKERNLLGLA